MTPKHSRSRADSVDEQAATQQTDTNRHLLSRSEDLHIRNLDASRSYELTITVRTGNESVVTAQYQLSPGERVSEFEQLTPGAYTIVAELGNERRSAAQCEINDSLSGGALIEIGNGAVAVTNGLYR